MYIYICVCVYSTRQNNAAPGTNDNHDDDDDRCRCCSRIHCMTDPCLLVVESILYMVMGGMTEWSSMCGPLQYLRVSMSIGPQSCTVLLLGTK
jgi:hypothetical protein